MYQLAQLFKVAPSISAADRIFAGGFGFGVIRHDKKALLGGGTFLDAEKVPRFEHSLGIGTISMSIGLSACALVKEDGSIELHGVFEFTDIGFPDPSADHEVVTIPGEFIDCELGSAHFVALDRHGQVWTWGRNDYGQLGKGNTSNKQTAHTPVVVSNNIRSIHAAENRTYMIDTQNRLWGVGENRFGELNTKASFAELRPTMMMEDVAQVAGGNHHTLILKTDGELYSCGRNHEYQLGRPKPIMAEQAVYIGRDYDAIAAGASHSVGLRRDGSLWTWGNNESGQLGNGTTNFEVMPKKVGDGYTQIACGGLHTLLLDSENNLSYFGWAGGKDPAYPNDNLIALRARKLEYIKVGGA